MNDTPGPQRDPLADVGFPLRLCPGLVPYGVTPWPFVTTFASLSGGSYEPDPDLVTEVGLQHTTFPGYDGWRGTRSATAHDCRIDVTTSHSSTGAAQSTLGELRALLAERIDGAHREFAHYGVRCGASLSAWIIEQGFGLLIDGPVAAFARHLDDGSLVTVHAIGDLQAQPYESAGGLFPGLSTMSIAPIGDLTPYIDTLRRSLSPHPA